jgi:hypothetical protein
MVDGCEKSNSQLTGLETQYSPSKPLYNVSKTLWFACGRVAVVWFVSGRVAVVWPFSNKFIQSEL